MLLEDTDLIQQLFKSNLSFRFDSSNPNSSAQSGLIASWKDLSGNNNHATESTDANKPSSSSNIQANKNANLWSGGSDKLTIASSSSADSILASGGTFVFVMNLISAGAGIGRLFEKSYNWLISSGPKITYNQPASTASPVWRTTNNISTGMNIIVITYNASNLNTAPVIYVNSVTPVAVTQTVVGAGTAISDASIAGYVGNRGAGDRQISAYFMEIAAGKKVLSSDEVNALLKHLGKKWNVTIS